MPQFLSTTDADFESRFAALLSAKREDSPDVDDVVAGIIADVRARGDEAVLELTAKFDRLDLTAAQMRVSEAEIDAEIEEAKRRHARYSRGEGSKLISDRRLPVSRSASEKSPSLPPDSTTSGGHWSATRRSSMCCIRG